MKRSATFAGGLFSPLLYQLSYPAKPTAQLMKNALFRLANFGGLDIGLLSSRET
jgi:hypothetical protein